MTPTRPNHSCQQFQLHHCIGETVEHAAISRLLDRAWLDYMKKRPSNADNLSFAKDNIEPFKRPDAHVRHLASENKLLAPGGRKLSVD